MRIIDIGDICVEGESRLFAGGDPGILISGTQEEIKAVADAMWWKELALEDERIVVVGDLAKKARP